MIEARVILANVCGAPEAEWRMTTESATIASSVFAVSIRVSPLETLLVDSEMLTTSAESRLPAISKDVLVRVEASKNKLMTDLPRNVGTFLMGLTYLVASGALKHFVRVVLVLLLTNAVGYFAGRVIWQTLGGKAGMILWGVLFGLGLGLGLGYTLYVCRASATAPPAKAG